MALAPEETRWSLSLAPGSLGNEKFTLLEVSEELLAELEASGVVIRGADDDAGAVLCTDSQTFEVKKVETSNLLMVSDAPLRPASDEGMSARDIFVQSTASAHLELVQCAPKVEPLRNALLRSVYRGDVDPEASDPSTSSSPGQTLEELLTWVPMSRAELHGALSRLGAVSVGGRWQAVDAGFRAEVVRMALLTCIAEGWSMGGAPLQRLCAALAKDGYDEDVVAQILRGVCQEPRSLQQGPPAPDELWAVDARRCCRAAAAALLHERPEWPEKEFLGAWDESLPGGLAPTLDMLAGEAVVVTTGAGARVLRLCASDLPFDGPSRFGALFAFKSRWSRAELEPYLDDLVGPGENREAVLMRHARVTQAPSEGAPEWFTARHAWA